MKIAIDEDFFDILDRLIVFYLGKKDLKVKDELAEP
jgi:hypothetical protein